MSNTQGAKMNEENKIDRVCYWEVADVESNGDIIIRVFSKDKQNELNDLVGKAKARHTKKRNETVEGDDRYNELVNVLGFEAQAEVFSAAGKAYVYNTKRELMKDIKLEEKKQAMQDGRKAKKERKERVKKNEVVTYIDVDSLVNITL